jgi:hypothetical protein
LPWSLGSSPTSPALGAKVWRKVWGISLDFESLEQSLSFSYEISRTPLPGPKTWKIMHDSLFTKKGSLSCKYNISKALLAGDRLHESMSQASGEIYRGGQIKRWLLKSRSAGLESEI